MIRDTEKRNTHNILLYTQKVCRKRKENLLDVLPQNYSKGQRILRSKIAVDYISSANADKQEVTSPYST